MLGPGVGGRKVPGFGAQINSPECCPHAGITWDFASPLHLLSLASSSVVNIAVAFMMRIARADIEQHTTRQSCWVAIHGGVYDVTGISPSATVIAIVTVPSSQSDQIS